MGSTKMRFRPPVTLSGRYLTLVPLDRSHAHELLSVGAEEEVFSYLRYGPFDTLPSIERFIDLLLERQVEGTDLPFVALRCDSGRAVGMTRYLAIERDDRSVEVGGTWFPRRFWRTPLNTESKRLLLGHAFETEGVHRVQIKTDLRNERSQRAIERLGAVREGILRESVVAKGGYMRSSVIYSILEDEWPRVRARLDRMLERPWSFPSTAASP